MERSRRKEIKCHLSEDEIDELLCDARDDHRLRRLGFLKNLYRGDSIPEAADREGRSAATGDRWAEAWNEGGLEELMPDFGGGRPPKLDEQQQEELIEMLRDDQPRKSQEIHHLLREEFGVEYSPNYLGTFLRDLGLSRVDSRSQRSPRWESMDEGGWIVDDDARTDGGVCEMSKPHPYR
jgi:transposase